MKIVVGLGNPGKEYAGTRHNVGFDVVGELAVRLGWHGSAVDFDRVARSKFDGLAVDGVMTTSTGREKLLLLKPMTYMNDSGRSVLAAMQFYQAGMSEVLVVLDDLALPCGQIRLRGEGSSGGHNGLKDIERVLGSNRYPRLRVGIDPVPPRIPQKDYVLTRFTEEQAKLMVGVTGAISRSAACAMAWADKGLTTAMNQFNVKDTTNVKNPQSAGEGGRATSQPNSGRPGQ